MSWQKKDSNKNDRKDGSNVSRRSGKVTANDENPPFDISGRMPPGKVVTEGKTSDGSKKDK
ncbi:hypothetical protein MZ16F84_34890 [Escherichia coli]